MYWQDEIRKLVPESADISNTVSSRISCDAPDSRVTTMLAEGKLQVETFCRFKMNFTTPRALLNTLEPSLLIGCWICAAYGPSTTAKARGYRASSSGLGRLQQHEVDGMSPSINFLLVNCSQCSANEEGTAGASVRAWLVRTSPGSADRVPGLRLSHACRTRITIAVLA